MDFERISYLSMKGHYYEEVFEALCENSEKLVESYTETPDDLWHRHCELVCMVPFEYRMFLLGSTLDGEIINGGLIQYFYNHRGIHNEDTLQTLEIIGATDIYRVFHQAVEQYNLLAHFFSSARKADEKSVKLNNFRNLSDVPEMDFFNKLDIEYETCCNNKPLLDYFVEYTLANRERYFID